MNAENFGGSEQYLDEILDGSPKAFFCVKEGRNKKGWPPLSLLSGAAAHEEQVTRSKSGLNGLALQTVWRPVSNNNPAGMAWSLAAFRRSFNPA
jgi:hypothetical protein